MGRSQGVIANQAGQSPLLERDAETAAIAEAIGRAREGEGGTLVIEGSAGIGKTALLGRTGERAASERLQVLRATGRQLERGFAFGLVRQLFEPAVGKLEDAERAQVLAGAAAPVESLLGAAPAGPALPDQAFAIIHGLYWLTVNLAERQPVVLLADDVQWADPPSLQALAYLAPRAIELPLLVVMARRTGEPGAEQLEWLRPAPHLEVLRPRGLTLAASAALVRTLVGAHASNALCGACHEVTGGNPFLVRELAQTVRQEGLDRDTEGAERIARLVPEGVSQATLARIQALDPNARELARALAVLERSELRHAAALAGLDETRAAEAAAALAEAHVLAAELPLRFAHPVLRSAVYSDLPAPARELSHRRAAKLLADAGADLDVVASQLLETEPRDEEWAVEALRGAAQRALARGAPPIAGRLIKRALAESPGHPERPELLLERGQAYMWGGHPKVLSALREAVDESTNPATRASALAALGFASMLAGDIRATFEAGRRGFEAIEGSDDPELELRVLWSYAMPACGDPRVGDELTAALERSSSGAPNVVGSARAAALAWNLLYRGEPAEQVASLARRALADERLMEIGMEGFAFKGVAAALLSWSGGLETALAACEEILAFAQRRGSVTLRSGAAMFFLCTRWMEQGLLPETLAELDVLASGVPPFGHTRFADVVRADVLLDRGQAAAAEAAIETATEMLDRQPHFLASFWLPLVRSRVRLQRGDPEGALADALAAGEAWASVGADSPAWGAWRSRAALAAARCGDQARAEELCEEELRRARRFGTPRTIGTALHASGLVQSGQAGIALLREADDVLTDSPALLERAKALVDLGSGLRRAGQRNEATEPLREGMDLAHRCGATAAVERASEELKALGARPRRYALSGRDALTPSELRVCELAAKGHSNREIAERLFVTRRTVETHLTHAYAKLEIEGREQLASALT